MSEQSETKRLARSDGAEMVYVPAGSFLMGSVSDDPAADPDEIPQREVHLDAYWIDRCEVTNRHYASFVKATGWRVPLGWSDSHTPADDHPVVGIAWADARAYAQWAGKDLPTEAQWEKAARGETGQAFPWGETWDPSRANTTAEMGSVGSYPGDESPYGCLDMAGNAWEWCRDWYNLYLPYDALSDVNPTGPKDWRRYWYRGTHFRVIRGGTYTDGRPARAADRLADLPPSTRYRTIGFRCVTDGDPSQLETKRMEVPADPIVIPAPADSVRDRVGPIGQAQTRSFDIELEPLVTVVASEGFENGDIGYYHYMNHFERLPNGRMILTYGMHPDARGPYPPIDSAELKEEVQFAEKGIRVSDDGGLNWQAPGRCPAVVGNVLSDGSVVGLHAWREKPEEGSLRISSDGGETVEHQGTFTIDTGDRTLGRFLIWGESSLVEMDDGSLGTILYAEESGVWGNYLIASPDRGRTWSLVSQVMGEPCPGRRYTTECSLVRCANGDLLAVSRISPTGQSLRGLYQCRSRDGGETWTSPEPCPGVVRVLWPFHSGDVSPHLIRVGDALALAYGRPQGLMLALSVDGTGEQWEPVTLMGAMREGLLEQEYGYMTVCDMTLPGNLGAQNGVSSHMPRMLATGENSLLIAFDVPGFSLWVVEDPEIRDLRAPDPDFPARNTVFVLPVTIHRV